MSTWLPCKPSCTYPWLLSHVSHQQHPDATALPVCASAPAVSFALQGCRETEDTPCNPIHVVFTVLKIWTALLLPCSSDYNTMSDWNEPAL